MATNMVGQSPAELAIEFEMIRQLNQRSTILVWHVSLAVRPDELISREQWAEIADCFIRQVGGQVGADEKSISPEENQALLNDEMISLYFEQAFKPYRYRFIP